MSTNKWIGPKEDNMCGVRGGEARRGFKTGRELKWKRLVQWTHGVEHCGLPHRCHAVASPGPDVVSKAGQEATRTSPGRTIRHIVPYFPNVA